MAATWAGISTIAFCENDAYCQRILAQHFPSIPIYPDITTLKGDDLRESVDLISGGFPCQPYSIAGRKRGTSDDRDLWPEMFRLIQELKPTWVIGENVAHFIPMAFTRTKTDLEGEGYTVQPFILPACGVGAPHRRDRAWIVAYTNGQRMSTGDQTNIGSDETGENKHRNRPSDSNQSGGTSANVANSTKQRPQRQPWAPYQRSRTRPPQSTHGKIESRMGGTFDGLSQTLDDCRRCDETNPWINDWEAGLPRVTKSRPNRVNRLQCLGNAVVPQVAYPILKAIQEISDPP